MPHKRKSRGVQAPAGTMLNAFDAAVHKIVPEQPNTIIACVMQSAEVAQ